MGKKGKLGLGIGCGLVLLIVVGVMGVGTWYAGRINQEYKEVTDSEKALLAATEKDQGFRPPPGGIPTPQRIEVFLAVRKELTPWRRTLATANSQFAADRARQKKGGLKDLARTVSTGSDLMPIYAGFWVARNEALLDHGMGPGEYSFIYRLVYRTGLEPERPAASEKEYQNTALDEALGTYREQLQAVFAAEVDLVELIFEVDGE